MKTTIPGRTGLRVSIPGLGCGGHSRQGMSRGKSMSHAAGMVGFAFEQEINFFDSSEIYGNEDAIGLVLQGWARDDYVLCTRLAYRVQHRLKTPGEIRQSLASSCAKLHAENGGMA